MHYLWKKEIKNDFRRVLAGLLMLLALPLWGKWFETEVWATEAVGVANPQYTLTTVDGTTVKTTTEDGKITLLMFGGAYDYYDRICSTSKNTLMNISQSEWIGSSNLRVIFAECYSNSEDVVKKYGQDYGCDNITFCYNTSDTILRVMSAYTGTNGGSLPVIVLIDSDNRVRSILEGEKTADEIKQEILKFAMLENEMAGTGVGDGTGNANPAYTLNAIDGTTISTKANAGQVSVFIFGYTDCGNSRNTVKGIAQSDWIDSTDARIVFADWRGATVNEMKNFASTYGHSKMIYCYDDQDPYGNLYKAMCAYLKMAGLNGGTYPYTVFIDGNDKVCEILTGPLDAATVKAKIDAYTVASSSPDPGNETDTKTDNDTKEPANGTGDSTGTENGTGSGNNNGNVNGTTGTDGGTGSEDSPATISKVSGLKAASQTTSSVKLSWSKVSGAEKYYIYQYDTSTKKWKKVASVSSSKLTYTVKKLKAGTAYRFGVKAYRTEGKEQILSGSYASLYTATKPAAVKFSVQAGAKKAKLTWSKVNGATGYMVYYRTSTKAAWKKLKTVKGTSYTATKLKSGQSYSFTVKAYKTYKGKTYTGSSKTKKVKIK